MASSAQSDGLLGHHLNPRSSHFFSQVYWDDEHNTDGVISSAELMRDLSEMTNAGAVLNAAMGKMLLDAIMMHDMSCINIVIPAYSPHVDKRFRSS